MPAGTPPVIPRFEIENDGFLVGDNRLIHGYFSPDRQFLGFDRPTDPIYLSIPVRLFTEFLRESFGRAD
jgi:hypothetical protein